MNCIILFYQIVQLCKRGSKFYKGGPHTIIEYGLRGPFSMGALILSVTGTGPERTTSHPVSVRRRHAQDITGTFISHRGGSPGACGALWLSVRASGPQPTEPGFEPRVIGSNFRHLLRYSSSLS